MTSCLKNQVFLFCREEYLISVTGGVSACAPMVLLLLRHHAVLSLGSTTRWHSNSPYSAVCTARGYF